MFQSFILPGISLGLSASVIPGPLQAYIINTTLVQGWRNSIFAIFSPLIIDIPIIAVVVFLLGQLPDGAIQVIRLAGGILLFWIAWIAWKQYRTGVRISVDKPTNSPESIPRRRILGTAMLLNALSPGPYLFWSTVNGPLLLSALEQSVLHAVVFLISFYGVFLGGLSVLVFVFHRLRGLDERMTARLLLFTIILLLWFGTSLILEALQIDNANVIAVIFTGVGLIGFVLIQQLKPSQA